MSNESKRESYREKNRLYMRKLRAVERGDVEALKKYDDKATTPHNLLGIKPAAEALWTQFNDYLDHNRTPCKDRPELYSDYDDPRYPDEATGVPMPTTGQAEALCAECPLTGKGGICLKYALAQKEDSGIWGGHRVVAGRIYQGGSGRNGS